MKSRILVIAAALTLWMAVFAPSMGLVDCPPTAACPCPPGCCSQ